MNLPTTTNSTPTRRNGSATLAELASSPQASLMSEASPMFCQLTFDDLPSAISSPGSGSGPLHLGPPDGPTIGLYGPDLAHANLSPAQAKEAGLLTSGTYGPIGSGSLATRNLTRSLASKLRAQMSGSILYGLTWKESVTPSGALKFQARASARRTSAPALTGWPTPTVNESAQDTINPTPAQTGGMTLKSAAVLAGWGTPMARDYNDIPGMNEIRPDGTSRMDRLPRHALLAGWGTPRVTNNGGIPCPEHTGKGCRLEDQAGESSFPTDSGLEVILSNGSIVAMKSGARLNPAHSHWLQAIPPQWDDYAPTETRSTLERRRSS
jgi:hypothetical protein